MTLLKEDNNNSSIQSTTVMGVIGNVIWILTTQSPDNLPSNLFSIDNKSELIISKLKIEWFKNRNIFVKNILSGYNLLSNGSFEDVGQKSLKDWTISENDLNKFGVDFNEQWHLTNGHTAYLSTQNNDQSTSIVSTQIILITANIEYQFSGYFATHRGTGLVTLLCYDENNIKVDEKSLIIPNIPQQENGQTLDKYSFFESKFIFNNCTQYIKVKIESQKNDLAPDAFLFFTKLYFGINDNKNTHIYSYLSSTDQFFEQLENKKPAYFGKAKLTSSVSSKIINLRFDKQIFEIELLDDLSNIDTKYNATEHDTESVFLKLIRDCLIGLKNALSDSEKITFIDTLEILQSKLVLEHAAGNYLAIKSIDVQNLLHKLFNEKADPNDISLIAYVNPNENDEANFQSFKNDINFSNPTQNELILHFLPQFYYQILNKIHEDSSGITFVKSKYSNIDNVFKIYTLSLETTQENSLFSINYRDYNSSDRERLIELICHSSLFNYEFYLQQTGLELGIKEAIEHYILSEEDQNFSPMPKFVSQDYREINFDIPVLSDIQCFVHYVLIGKSEKRYYNRSILKRDAFKLFTYSRFDNHPNSKKIPIDWSPAEYYLAIGWRNNLYPSQHPNFDSQVYLNIYSDAIQSEYPPYLHFLIKNQNRLSNKNEIQNTIINTIVNSGEFDFDYYQEQCNQKGIVVPNSRVEHYVLYGCKSGLNPNKNFDIEYYAKQYPELLTKNINNLFEHYIAYGIKEERIAKANNQNQLVSGSIQFDTNKPTIVIACHEAARGGAPILGLELVKELSLKANIICWLGKNGELTQNFIKSSFAIIHDRSDYANAVFLIRELKKHYLLSAAILNSVATSNLSYAFYEEKVPIIALVHEYSDYMSANITQILFDANRIIFPANGVKESANINSINSCGFIGTNSVIKHQGRCLPPRGKNLKTYDRENILLHIGISEDDETPFIVLGCGLVQIRKGIEFFIETAKYCKEFTQKSVHFIWVGAGYQPNADLNYSTWLKSQIFHSGLETDVSFFEETDDLSVFFEMADVFFISSRLDPFPNVALDAVNAGVPIIAFERATGFTDFIYTNPTIGVTVPFLDVRAAAEAICDYANGKRCRIANNEKIINELSFSNYANFVWNECQIAIQQQKQIEEESQLIERYKLLDIDFYKSATPNWISAVSPEYHYVAACARGLGTAKSRIGFNDNAAQTIWSEQMAKNKVISPLVYMFHKNLTLRTHNLIYIDPNKNIEQQWTKSLSVAVHIHAHYTESLTSLLDRFSNINKNITFFITTNTEDKAKILSASVQQHDIKHKIIIVPNRGRDIGPFIMVMKAHLSNFDVVGHFHIKGTKQLEQSIVQQWQNFLYNTLIGSQGEIASTILNNFIQDPKLGLTFQEDPCLPSWTKNKQIADNLLNTLSVSQKTLDVLEYPTGNMFWARPSALSALINHHWKWSDFPAEPIPYDGTILHAIERITPIICNEAGYQWATVHNITAKRYINE